MDSEHLHLAHYFIIGSRAAMSGERFLIEDKFSDNETATCQLRDENSGELASFVMSGILNLNEQTILLLGSANPEDLESPFRTYSVVRVLSPTTVELVEESFAARIFPVAEAAINLDRSENQKLLEQYFGPFRANDGKKLVSG